MIRTLIFAAIASLALTGCPHKKDDSGVSDDATPNQAIFWVEQAPADAGDQRDLGTLTANEAGRSLSATCTNPIRPLLLTGETELPSGFLTQGVTGKWKLDSITSYMSVHSDSGQNSEITGGFMGGQAYVGCQTAQAKENINSVASIPYEVDADSGKNLVTASLVLEARKGLAGGQLQLSKDLKPLPLVPMTPPPGIRAVFARVSDSQIVMRVEITKPTIEDDGASVLASEVTYVRE